MKIHRVLNPMDDVENVQKKYAVDGGTIPDNCQTHGLFFYVTGSVQVPVVVHETRTIDTRQYYSTFFILDLGNSTDRLSIRMIHRILLLCSWWKQSQFLSFMNVESLGPPIPRYHVLFVSYTTQMDTHRIHPLSTVPQ